MYIHEGLVSVVISMLDEWFLVSPIDFGLRKVTLNDVLDNGMRNGFFFLQIR